MSKHDTSVSNGDYDMSGDFCIEIRGVVRGYHVYKSVWIPVLGEQLATQQEYGNACVIFSKRRQKLILAAVWRSIYDGIIILFQNCKWRLN